MFAKKRKAFSLIELLVVISVVALLMAVLMPALASARAQAHRMVCRSNLRQLVLANSGYAVENDGHYVPAAPDITAEMGGMYRWHGLRSSPDEPFDPMKGPLAAYLAGGQVKECPERVNFVDGQDWNTNFEQGCGGYGYNHVYLGSRNWQDRQFKTLEQSRRAGWETTKTTEVGRPTETLMFADTAMSNRQSYLIEYSFAEPPFYVYKGKPVTSYYLSASIHFRHRGRANVGWTDGHVDSRRMADFDTSNAYGVDCADMGLGWFEPVDNTPFDLD